MLRRRGWNALPIDLLSLSAAPSLAQFRHGDCSVSDSLVIGNVQICAAVYLGLTEPSAFVARDHASFGPISIDVHLGVIECCSTPDAAACCRISPLNLKPTATRTPILMDASRDRNLDANLHAYIDTDRDFVVDSDVDEYADGQEVAESNDLGR